MSLTFFGLGNPYAFYAATRHNVGQAALERAAALMGVQFEDYPLCRMATTKNGTQFVIPTTGMNESGSVLRASTGWNEQLIVVYDDMSLPFGQIRTKSGSSMNHAGHNGIKSIIAEHGPEFIRFKIGIGEPAHGQNRLEHALSPFTPLELAQLGSILHAVAYQITEMSLDAQPRSLDLNLLSA